MIDDRKAKLDDQIAKIDAQRKQLIARKKRLIARENAAKRKHRSRMLILLGAAALEVARKNADGDSWLREIATNALKPDDAKALIQWWDAEYSKPDDAGLDFSELDLMVF